MKDRKRSDLENEFFIKYNTAKMFQMALDLLIGSSIPDAFPRGFDGEESSTDINSDEEAEVGVIQTIIEHQQQRQEELFPPPPQEPSESSSDDEEDEEVNNNNNNNNDGAQNEEEPVVNQEVGETSEDAAVASNNNQNVDDEEEEEVVSPTNPTELLKLCVASKDRKSVV